MPLASSGYPPYDFIQCERIPEDYSVYLEYSDAAKQFCIVAKQRRVGTVTRGGEVPSEFGLDEEIMCLSDEQAKLIIDGLEQNRAPRIDGG